MLSRPKSQKSEEIFSSTDKIEYFTRECVNCHGDGCIVTDEEMFSCSECGGTGITLGYRPKCNYM